MKGGVSSKSSSDPATRKAMNDAPVRNGKATASEMAMGTTMISMIRRVFSR